MKQPGALLWLVFSALAACASATPAPSSRNYERAEARDLKLRRLEVVVSAAPINTSGPILNVPTFDPPTPDGALRPSKEDAQTRDALVAALRNRLTSAGFAVSFRHGGVIPAPTVAPLPRADTSTRASVTSSAGVSRAPSFAQGGPTALSADLIPLPPGTSLDAVLKASVADAVLVVRVVPVDAFYVFAAGGGSRTIVEDDGSTRRVGVDKPLLRSGRLLLGQAFLFDKATGLRLWSRQLPDFPSGGALAVDDPFLGYGVVGDPSVDAELPPTERAVRASARFVERMLSELPPPSDGKAEARQALASVDVASDVQKESELDRSLLGLELSANYAGESAGTKLELDGDDTLLDDLGTGALAPSGVLRAVPGLMYRAPGGLSLGLGLPIGRAPGSFARAYHKDGASPETGSNNRTATVTFSGVTTVGLELRAGYALVLSEQFQLVPAGGAFVDLWLLSSASPSTLLPDDTHVRFGLLGTAELIYKPKPDSMLYFKAAPVLRLGLDHAGPAVLGGGLSLGMGVFL